MSLSLTIGIGQQGHALDVLAAELRRLFGNSHVVGCTTAGEIGSTGYVDGSITGFSISAAIGCSVSELIRAFSDFQMGSGYAAAEAALAGLSVKLGGVSVLQGRHCGGAAI